jgi:hypothetical protein
MGKYNKIISEIIAKPIAKFVNSFDEKQKHHFEQKEPMTKDKFIYGAFGGTGYKYLSDEGKEKYWLDHFNAINPPKKELTETQKFSKDPKAYLDEYFSDHINKVDNDEDIL